MRKRTASGLAMLLWMSAVASRRSCPRRIPPAAVRRLRGSADHLDLVLARDDGRVDLWRNFGSKASPRWCKHYVMCPMAPSAFQRCAQGLTAY